MISKKTFPTFALIAILMLSMTPSSAFALTPDEEIAQGQLNDFDPNAQPQSSTSVFDPNNDLDVVVGVEMNLLMDVSGSVVDTEFNLQRDGYEAAFRSQDVIDLLAFGCPGEAAQGIAVQFIYWSSFDEQQIAVPWSLLTDSTSSNAFADAISNAGRPFSGLTAPGSAINFAVPTFANNFFNGDRQVIDVSGDGIENDGDDTSDARDAAIAGVVDVINGIVISPQDVAGLLAFYQSDVQGGVGSFTVEAADFTDFTPAIEDKIITELCPGPVGGESLSINTASLMVAGIYANALWILPALAGIAGAGVFVIRSRMNKD